MFFWRYKTYKGLKLHSRIDREFLINMLKIALPIMIQNLVTSSLNMVDTIMTGKLGEVEIAVVGIANQYFFFFNTILIVFMAAGFIDPGKIISLFNKDSTVIDLGEKYLFIVLFSYIFIAITFIYSYSLRSIGNTVVPLVVNIAALLCNVFFNYTLIFGKFGAPALGVEGAAIATLIARVVEATILVFLVYKDNGVFAVNLKELKDLNISFFKKSYKIIMPVLLNDVFWAMASASSIMIGNSIGKRREDKTIDYAKKFMEASLYISIILGLSLALTSPFILDLFNVSSEVKSSTLIMLYIISLIFIVRFLGMVIIVGILRGAGDARSVLIIEGSTMWFIGVPLTIIGVFVFKLPVHLVYALAILEEIAKFILGLMRLKSRKWIVTLLVRE